MAKTRLTSAAIGGDQVYLPEELWLVIAIINTIISSRLSQTSTFFHRLLNSDRAWNLREATLTKHAGHRLFATNQQFFQRHYKNLGLRALDEDILSDDLKMLTACVENGLEQLFQRRAQGLPAAFFSEDACRAFLLTEGLYTNGRPEMARIVLNLLQAQPIETRHRLITQACFSAADSEVTHFVCADSETFSLFWNQLPLAMRQAFFQTDIPPWSDMLKEELPQVTPANRRELLHALLLAMMSSKFTNIQFILDLLPANVVADRLQLALYLQYFLPLNFATKFISLEAQSMRLLLNALPESQRIADAVCNPAINFYFGDMQAFASSPLPPLLVTYLQAVQVTLSSDNQSIQEYRAVAKSLYGTLLVHADKETLGQRISAIRARIQTNMEFYEIIQMTMMYALVGNVHHDMISLLAAEIDGNNREKQLTLTLFKLVQNQFARDAIARFLLVMENMKLVIPVLKRFVIGATPGVRSSKAYSQQVGMSDFETVMKYSPAIPWQTVMEELFHERLSRNEHRNDVLFLTHFSRFPCTQAAIKVVALRAISVNNIQSLKRPFGLALARGLRSAAIPLWDAFVQQSKQKALSVKMINYVSKTSGEILYELAVYDTRNDTHTLTFLCCLSDFDINHLAHPLLRIELNASERATLLKAYKAAGLIIKILLHLLKQIDEGASERIKQRVNDLVGQLDRETKKSLIIQGLLNHIEKSILDFGLPLLAEAIFDILDSEQSFHKINDLLKLFDATDLLDLLLGKTAERKNFGILFKLISSSRF